MKVAIVGAGIVGAATARALARRGVEVELFDAGEVSGGTTGLGEGNVLCSDKDGGPELALAVLGRAAYDEIEATLRRARADPAQGRAGRAPRRGRAGGRARADRAAAGGGRGVRAARARARRARSSPGSADLLGATSFPGDLQCDPRAIARAMAEEPGITVRAHTRVEDLTALRRGRGRARRRAVERGARPHAPGCSCRSSRARASSSGSPAGWRSATRWSTAATSPRSRAPEAGSAGLDRARDDVRRQACSSARAGSARASTRPSTRR